MRAIPTFGYARALIGIFQFGQPSHLTGRHIVRHFPQAFPFEKCRFSDSVFCSDDGSEFKVWEMSMSAALVIHEELWREPPVDMPMIVRKINVLSIFVKGAENRNPVWPDRRH